MSLSDAIARLSLFPAMRMQAFAPAFFKKGRISVGADADLVIFDPASTAASADYDEPFLPPAGIDFVLVGGSVAAESGAVVTERGSGKKLLGARQELSGPSSR